MAPTGTAGAGQVIAIIDAYHDANALSDLNAFNAEYGYPTLSTCPSGPPFTSTTGACFYQADPQGTPVANSDWILEESLDIEWAHAEAPGATIVLVEAQTSSTANLYDAVSWANENGATEESMSWTSSEASDETSYDSYFDATAKSTGEPILYTAAAGDGGHAVAYPAASPNVIGVGGTTLNGCSGASCAGFTSETAWSDSGGGVSAYETIPAYQSAYEGPVYDESSGGITVLTEGMRGIPDVSFDANPNTGVSVYDSTAYDSQSGWFTLGGTSVGSPNWAGILAVGASSAAPLQGGRDAYGGGYKSYLRDITSGTNGSCGTDCTAGTGYDLVTGLGGPINYIPSVGELLSGSELASGQSISGPNGAYDLVMQADGNLVEYSAANTPIWSSDTSGNPGAYVSMQGDGNLVVYSAARAPLWSSNTSGNAGAFLTLSYAGQLAVESETGELLWTENLILTAGSELASGQSISGPNGAYDLVMQADGNLVEYSAANTPIWSSDTSGNPGAYVSMQGDGNLVVYSAARAPLWSSNTSGNAGAFLTLSYAGQLAVESETGELLWTENLILTAGSELASGQSISGPNGAYDLVMQADGNLVEYSAANTPIWSSDTSGNPGAYVSMQGDGNLVVYSAARAPLWSSNTSGNAGAFLTLSYAGQLAVESETGELLWTENLILTAGSELASGQSISGPNGAYDLVMQADGNLVEYSAANTPIWSSDTSGNPGAYVSMQGDGNLVVYSAARAPLWSSNTSGNAGAFLTLSYAGQLAVESETGELLWTGPTPA